MFDVRIFHANADSYREKEISSLYKLHKNAKRRDYEQRVTQVEKSSFTPLVYSTTGGMGPLATAFHQRVASLVAERKQERYGDVLSLMRTKLSFALLKSVLVSIRGARGKTTRSAVTPLSCVSFNLVPEGLKYSAPNKFE